MPDDSVAAFDALPRERAVAVLLSCCSSRAWAEAVAAGRPFGTAGRLHEAAEAALAGLDEDGVDEALADHPRIGERPSGPEGASSRREQSGVVGAADDTLAAIAAGNLAYERRFGHVYLVCATGRGADELLAVLEQRLGNDPAHERRVVRHELAAINRIRLDRLLEELRG